MNVASVTAVIPTFEREQVLLDTIDAVLNLGKTVDELLIIDQTKQHEPKTEETLKALHRSGRLKWIQLPQPSIPHAMNVGLLSAGSEIVLFLDDDITPGAELVAAHLQAHYENADAWAVVGQVLQPGEEPTKGFHPSCRTGLRADLDFPFHSQERDWVSNVMAGNLSVKRFHALRTGGFDEQFVGVAYRFETEFCRRIIRSGGRVLFEPRASIRHLRCKRGGTRATGSHLTSVSPIHGVGDYYFAMRGGRPIESLTYIVRRMIREVSTKFHLRRPWWIPVKVVGEMRALLLAYQLNRRGPSLRQAEYQSALNQRADQNA